MKNNQIKYRQYIPEEDRFHYWGFIDGVFVSPVSDKYESERFTVLSDSDGECLYQNDIVRLTFFDEYSDNSFLFGEDSELIMKIYWSSDSYWGLGTKDKIYLSLVNIYDYATVEVIGNIHQHKHLLEG